MRTFTLRLTPGTIAANQDTIAPTIDEQIVELHRQGIPRRKIEQSLQVSEYHVRRVTSGVDKGQKTPTDPFGRAVVKIYPLAVSPLGIKDFQFRNIMFECYGSTWDPEEEQYEVGYDKHCASRVRMRVREIADSRGEVAVFLLDWFDARAPVECNRKIRECAMTLAQRLQDVVDEYMVACGVELVVDEGSPNQFEGDRHLTELARQASAARLHILKLAIPEFNTLKSEPVGVLIERAEEQANDLVRMPDAMMSKAGSHYEDYPDPTGNNPFLDYVEDQGWLRPEHYAEVAESIANLGY